MSKINIDRIVKDIKTRSTSLTPVVEAVCNSIDAINSERVDGKIDIIVKRDPQQSLDIDIGRVKADIVGIDISDNGEGFTMSNRESFDTYRSGLKLKSGGKGFGRFMYLKYFNHVSIESTYKDEDGCFYNRSFTFGHADEIIENEKIELIRDDTNCTTGTVVHLSSIKSKDLDKGLEVIARKLVERLLCFFAIGGKHTPIITIKEEDGDNPIVLNNYIGPNSDICQIGEVTPISIQGKNRNYAFKVKVYKIYYSAITNKVCLTANMREVTDAPLYSYVPEFKDAMTENSENYVQKNYMVKVYVQGDYLDENVTTERDSFLFGKEDDTYFELSERAIYKEAAMIAKSFFIQVMKERYIEKKKKVERYVCSMAPWNKTMLNEVDMEKIPVGISDFELEMLFQEMKFEKEKRARIALKELLSKSDEETYDGETLECEVRKILSLVTDSQKSDLAHYVCQRKKIIDLYEGLRRRMKDGKPHLESEMHNLFFPMIKDDREVEYEEHNLWLLDERFNFTQYIASDKVISKSDHKEPDLALFYEESKFFRNGDNVITSPVAIVEFKRPKRTDYSDNENPIIQALRYAGKILAGKYEMPDGLEKVDIDKSRTPVYIYIVCDLADKIREFAQFARLTISPDNEGYFGYNEDYNAYIEIKSYKKVILDARMRNQIFFNRLGLG